MCDEASTLEGLVNPVVILLVYTDQWSLTRIHFQVRLDKITPCKYGNNKLYHRAEQVSGLHA